LLQSLDPLVHGGRGESGGLPEVRERHASVRGQERHDASVQVLHAATLTATGGSSTLAVEDSPP
jgi:hypothetical protein